MSRPSDEDVTRWLAAVTDDTAALDYVRQEVERARAAEAELVEQLRWSHAMLETFRQWIATDAQASFAAGLRANRAALKKAGVES
jgi:hypothetical protein